MPCGILMNNTRRLFIIGQPVHRDHATSLLHRVACSSNLRNSTRRETLSQNTVPPDTGSAPKAPRWVKVTAVCFATLLLVVVAMHLTGRTLGGRSGHMSHLTHGVCPQ